MFQNPRHSTKPQAQRGRPLSLDSSMIYSLLPSAVQNRLPRLGSHRKTMCSSESDLHSQDDSRCSRMNEYSSEMVIRDAQSVPDTIEFAASYFESRSEAEENSAAQVESRSGIDWKFANQGINLLSLSVKESATISRNPTGGSASFARRVYLDGVRYLLRGLPSDLTTEEQLSIQGSLPRALLKHEDPNGEAQFSVSHSEKAAPPSILHKMLASTIVQLFILFQFLLPYFKFLLRSAYEYERTHHISEKILASSLDAADSMGKHGLAVTAALYGMGNGKVGEVVTEAASWLIEGITGGIHDGIGEGLNVMGAKRQTSVSDDNQRLP